jgi:hypothetical protein
VRPRAGLDVCGKSRLNRDSIPEPSSYAIPVRKETEYRKKLNEKIWLNTHSISTTPAPSEEVLIKTDDKVHGLSSVLAPKASLDLS